MLVLIGKVLPTLFFPLGLALWTSALALWLLARGRRRLGLGIGLASWAWLYVASISPFCHLLLAPLEKPYYHQALPDTASAIVLLGGAVVPATPPRTHPSLNQFADRILQASRLWNEKRAPRLVTTGGRISWIVSAKGSEAQDYASLLTELFGVDSAAIHLCPGSQTTRDDAVEARKLFESRGWPKDIFLVTSAFHLRRAAALFRKQGFTVHEAPANFFTQEVFRFQLFQLVPQEGTLQHTYLAIHEWIGYAAYRVLGWV